MISMSAKGGCEVRLARAPDRPSPADLALLDDGEREEAARLATRALRAHFAHRRALLRRVLGETLGQAPESLRFRRGRRGRLRLDAARHGADGPPPDFSLSGSGALIALAVAARGRVGVDLEVCRDGLDREALLARYAAPEERRWLRRLYGRARRDGFFTLWTLKEAWSKATGAGLGAPFASARVLPQPDGTVAADLSAAGGDAMEWRLAWRALPGPTMLAVAWHCPDPAA